MFTECTYDMFSCGDVLVLSSSKEILMLTFFKCPLFRPTLTWLTIISICLLTVLPLPAQATGAFHPLAAATLIVTTTNDSGPGSLRQAIADAVPGDVITFNLPDHSTITLASELVVTKNLTINGPGAAHLTISGNNAVRVLQVNGGTLILDGV